MIKHSIELALAGKIGGSGIPATALDAGLVRAGRALESLKNAELPLVTLVQQQDDLAEVQKTAKRITEGARDIVFLGTGGSSLGGQTLAQLGDHAVAGLNGIGSRKIALHFMDNLDPLTYGQVLERFDLATTRFVAISKSGGTGETLMQTMALLSLLHERGHKNAIPHLITGLSEPRREGVRNALRDLLEPEGVTFLEHHTGIGGRYSGLTNVGLLPAACLGLDIYAIRKGAEKIVRQMMETENLEDIPSVTGAALNVAASYEGKNITVLMAYSDRLERLTRWWVQLWAESIGKQGLGTQPVAAIGPVDQHSQLQLYLAGPNDRLFTILTLATKGKGPRIDKGLAERAGEPGLAGKTIGDLVAAQGRATADTLARNGRPTRTIECAEVDAHTLGALMMHFMLETILAGFALGVDPFDQPAVEEGKLLAKKYLSDQA